MICLTAMADTINVSVSGLRADVTKEQVSALFASHGYVKEVTILEPSSDAPPDERSAIVVFAKRSALEAAGEALEARGVAVACEKTQKDARSQTNTNIAV